MALIICEECGKEYSDKADACPNCGNPNLSRQSVNVTIKEKEKGFWSTGRLAIGIICCALSIIVFFQSCAAGIGEAIEESEDAGSGAGLICFLIFLVCGIISICTRNSKSKGVCVVLGILYLLNGIISASNSEIYKDLQIWGFLSCVFGAVFIICAVKTKKD